MKKTTAAILFALINTIWISIIIYHGITEERLRFSGIRYLQSIIQIYAHDALIAKREKIFPSSFDDLIRENYIATEDLEKLTHKQNVKYTPPLGNGQSTDIILEATSDKHRIICPLYGRESILKK